MRVLGFTSLLWLVRRTRPVGLAFALYNAWRRLPPEHRRTLLVAARRNAPLVASALVRRRPR